MTLFPDDLTPPVQRRQRFKILDTLSVGCERPRIVEIATRNARDNNGGCGSIM